MRFENIEYNSGDVLIVYNETLKEKEVYMVSRRYNAYNILDLNTGVAYFSNYEGYEDFVRKLEGLFVSIRIIHNNQLELVSVEED